MHRQFEALLFSSESNTEARKLYEEAFAKLKVDVGVVVGLFMFLTQKMINSLVLVIKSLVILKVLEKKKGKGM